MSPKENLIMAETKKKSVAKAPSAEPAISSEQAQPSAPQENPQTGLTLQDLVTVAQIIQSISSG